MDGMFKELKGFFKKPSTIIDNLAFRFHYRVTCVFLFGLSLLVTSKQYFGDPIDCISKDDVKGEILDNYCWLHTTFSIVSAWQKRVGIDVPYPGVDKSNPEEKRVYHAYYQWVCFVLALQAIFFYAPRFLWKSYEDGRIAKLTKGLKQELNKDPDKGKLKGLLYYLSSYQGRFNSLFYVYFSMEILNLVNVIVQMLIMDKFLGGEFSTYGWQVLSFTEWDWSSRYDPMMKVFPRLTKCTFHRFGSSGDIMKYDAMCILPINIFNEKIYVFLWFWFYIMAIISMFAVLWRLGTLLIKPFRVSRIAAHCPIADRYELDKLIAKRSVGDWFMLDLLSRNMDPVNFNYLLSYLYSQEDNRV